MGKTIREVAPHKFDKLFLTEDTVQIPGALLMACWFEPATVIPGQPLTLRWEAYSFNSTVSQSSVTGELFYLNKSVRKTTNVSFVHDRTGPQSESAIKLIGNKGGGVIFAKDTFYTFGQKFFVFQLTVSIPGNPPLKLSKQLSLEVVPENDRQANYIGFSKDFTKDLNQYSEPFDIEYNENFYVLFEYWNKSQYTSTTGSAVVRIDNQDSVTNHQLPDDFCSCRPGGYSALGLGPATQTWPWINPVTLMPFDPCEYSRVIKHTLIFTLEDEYGNQYPATFFGDGWTSYVKVTIPTYKIVAGWHAFISFTEGIVLLSSANPFCMLAGAACIVQAYISYAIAMDPPSPKPNYLDEVDFPVYPIPSILQSEKSMTPFVFYLTLSNTILGGFNALSETQSRLLGAHLDKKIVGIKKQKNRFRQIVRIMKSAARQLPVAASAVMQSEAAIALKGQRFNRNMENIFQNGLPGQLVNEVKRIGLTNKDLKHFRSAVRDKELQKQSKKGLEQNLSLAVMSLVKAVSDIEQRTKEMLRDPIFVLPVNKKQITFKAKGKTLSI